MYKISPPLAKNCLLQTLFSLFRQNGVESKDNTCLSKQLAGEKPVYCPSLEGNMDMLTQEQFMSRLTHHCRYDKLIKPKTDEPLQIFIRMDISHIEAIDQLVSVKQRRTVNLLILVTCLNCLFFALVLLLLLLLLLLFFFNENGCSCN